MFYVFFFVFNRLHCLVQYNETVDELEEWRNKCCIGSSYMHVSLLREPDKDTLTRPLNKKKLPIVIKSTSTERSKKIEVDVAFREEASFWKNEPPANFFKQIRAAVKKKDVIGLGYPGEVISGNHRRAACVLLHERNQKDIRFKMLKVNVFLLKTDNDNKMALRWGRTMNLLDEKRMSTEFFEVMHGHAAPTIQTAEDKVVSEIFQEPIHETRD